MLMIFTNFLHGAGDEVGEGVPMNPDKGGITTIYHIGPQVSWLMSSLQLCVFYYFRNSDCYPEQH